MNEESPRKGKPLPAHVLRKFREKNEQVSFQAQVRKVIDDFNEHLETFGEIRNRRLVGCPKTLGEAVADHFRKAGWTVTVVHTDDTCVFTLKLD